MGRLLPFVVVGLTGCFFDSRMLDLKHGLSAQQIAESRAAAQLTPAPIVQPRAAPHARLAVLKVRVWADDSYRRRHDWRQHVNSMLGRANRYLGPAFGVELRGDVRPWPREAEVDSLAGFLNDVQRMDPGDDVDHVVALTGALPLVTSNHEMLGLATLLGKHMVMRAMNDPAERRALAESLPTLGRDDLDELEGARTEHKETVVFLHEWAHNYGAMHEEGAAWLMSPSYEHGAGQLSDANERLVTLALAARHGDPAAVDDLRRHVAEAEWGGWDRREREQLLRIVNEAAGPRAAPAAARPEPDPDPLGHATAQRRAGRVREALATLDAWAATLPDEPSEWRQLALAYLWLEACQRAEAVLGRTGDAAEELRARIVRQRRQRGLFGVAGDDEPEAAALIETARVALAAGRRAEARALVGEGLRRWSKLAGLLALDCALALEQGALARADRACGVALAASDETLAGLFYAAQVAERRGRPAEAIQDYERMVALDPDEPSGYEGLVPLYRSQGRADKLHELRVAYVRRFKRGL